MKTSDFARAFLLTCFIILEVSTFSARVFAQPDVFQGVGNPEILGASSRCFQSSYNGEIDVQVTNTGTSQAAFETSANCDAPIRVLGSSIDTFAPSEIKTVYIPITGMTSIDQQPSCSVQSVDKASLAVSNIYNLKTCIQNSQSCSPAGSTSCSGNNIYVCQPTGLKELKQNCPFGCKFDFEITNYRCIRQGEVKEEIPNKITTGGGIFTKQAAVIILILLVLAGGITYLIKKLFKIK